MLRRQRPLAGLAALWLLALICALAAPCAAANAPVLHARVTPAALAGVDLDLSDEDRRWLWRHRRLAVGVTRPDQPPFDVLGNGQHYEGISAEYLQLLSDTLRLDVTIVAFDSREQALAALREGRIDLLTGSTGDEAQLPWLARSIPYAEDEPVLVRRAVPPRPETASGQTVAVRPGYRGAAPAGLAADVRYREVPSLLTGLAAVALGQADALLGNARAVAAQLAQSPLDGREQVRFLVRRPAGIAFALRAGASRLRSLVNVALEAAPPGWRAQVDDTWNGAAPRLSEARPVVLTAAERDWMAAHPRVRVGYLREFAPLSFENREGHFRGLAADLLARISQRTGLAFEPVALASHAELLAALRRGEIDLAATMASGSAGQGLRLSRAWLSAVPVLVVSGPGAAVEQLEHAEDKTMRVPAALGLQATLAQRWPGIRWQQRDTALEALADVSSQRAAGAVLPYVQARALLAGNPGLSLRIAGALPLAPPRYGFAAMPGQQPLLGILDQALLSFGPARLDDMARRWRSEVRLEPHWPGQARWLLPAFAVAGAMLLLAVIWIRLLRRQVRRRRAAEQALTDQLEFMRVMIDGTPHPVYVRDRGGHLLDCNASYLAALGVEREAVIGQEVTRIPLATDLAQEYEALYRKVIAGGQPIVEDRQLRLCNGRQLTVFHWMLPYRASNASIVGLIGGWIDITERQRLYDALQTAKEAADAANSAKTCFLATASHEIRTPMNAVLGMLELALRKAETGELDRLALRVASESASGLLELLNDILDISRIESGHLTLNPRAVDLAALARQVVHLYQAKAREKGLRLDLKIGPGASGGVMIDPLRFQQVLGNLLSNAIKFTHEGGVTVTLAGRSEGAELALRLVVEDTGIGIPEADLRRLCQPYQQAANHAVSGRAGAGLGLSITQALCRLMGGGVELTSREGEGSRVLACLRLPACDLPGPEPQAGPAAVAQAALEVLVVDDHEPNRLLLAQQLSYLGHRVVVAVNGAHGLREWCARGGFDAVICDCQMPVLDGYDLARAIRLEEQRKGLAPCRLLACTADASAGQRQRCREAGADECLVKPLGLEALAAALAEPSLRTPAVPGNRPGNPGAHALLALAGGCAPSARRLRDSLLEALRQDAARLQGLSPAAPEIDDVVHRVKGGARIVGALALVERCEAVERGESTVQPLLAEMDTLQRQLRAMQFSPASTGEPERPRDVLPAQQPKPAA